MNTNTNDKTTEPNDAELIDRVIRDAGAIGKVWARYGLEVGKSALQTSATTLQKTAGLLGEIAARFQEEAHREDKPAVTTTGETVATNDKPQA